jgi:hypothetical protein
VFQLFIRNDRFRTVSHLRKLTPSNKFRHTLNVRGHRVRQRSGDKWDGCAVALDLIRQTSPKLLDRPHLKRDGNMRDPIDVYGANTEIA